MITNLGNLIMTLLTLKVCWWINLSLNFEPVEQYNTEAVWLWIFEISQTYERIIAKALSIWQIKMRRYFDKFYWPIITVY